MGFQIERKPTRLWPAFLLLLLIMLTAAGLYGLRAGQTSYAYNFNEKKPTAMKEALAGLKADNLIADNFETHLPLITFTPDNVDFTYSDQEVTGTLRLINGPGPVNRPADAPSAEMKVSLNRLDQASGTSVKSRFRISRADRGGPMALLGLSPDKTWLLEGSGADQTMLRNYLAYTLGREIFGQAPQTRLCEVIIKVGDGFLYQGVHLLSETPVRGLKAAEVDKSFIFKYNPAARAAAPRKDNGDPGFAVLPGGRFEPVYAGPGGQNQKTAEKEISQAEIVVNSREPDIYFNYKVILDSRSFIDTFILNDLLMNYQAEGLAAYIYKTKGRKLRLGPVWNYDLALDNTEAPLPGEAKNAARTLWLPQLFKNTEFVNDYRARYYRLFRGPLAPERINRLIDETIDYLGPALKRDWKRWAGSYGAAGALKPAPAVTAEGEILIRSTSSYEQEVVKIKYLIREHDRNIRKRLLEMRWAPDLIDGSTRIWRGAVLSILFVVLFFLTVTYARKKY